MSTLLRGVCADGVAATIVNAAKPPRKPKVLSRSPRMIAPFRALL
jgi:hypothetical protein